MFIEGTRTDVQIEMSDVRGRGCTVASLEQVSCLKELPVLWSIVEEDKVFISVKEMSYEFILYHCLSVKQMSGEYEHSIDISQLKATECITIQITLHHFLPEVKSFQFTHDLKAL